MKKRMNKTELVKAVAAGSGLSLTDAAKAVGAAIEAITKSMQAGEPVVIPGFGSFTIAARKVTCFRPGKGLDLTGNKTAE